MQPVFNSLLVLALVVSGAALTPAMPLPGDTNGDRKVDVLDVQCVVAEVLNTKGGAAGADVNSDGRVDVLDYQCIVAGARAGAQGQTPAEPLPTEAPATDTKRMAPALVGLVCQSPAPEPLARYAHGHGFREFSYRTDFSRARRYQLCLTPHAPPRIELRASCALLA